MAWYGSEAVRQIIKSEAIDLIASGRGLLYRAVGENRPAMRTAMREALEEFKHAAVLLAEPYADWAYEVIETIEYELYQHEYPYLDGIIHEAAVLHGRLRGIDW